MKEKKTIAIVINTAWNIYNFRRNLIKRLQQQEYEVILIAPEDEYVPQLRALGCRFIPIKRMDKRGTNPLKDIALLVELRRIYKQEAPDLILHYTIKPNIFGNLAARLTGTKTISTVTGQGRVSVNPSLFNYLIRQLYRLAFSYCLQIIFQNKDDYTTFIQNRLVTSSKSRIVAGSGVDLQHFHPKAKSQSSDDNQLTFLLVARLLLDKGVREYAEAARQIKASYPTMNFWLLGPLDKPNGVKERELSAWEEEGILNYLGTTDNVKQYLEDADVVVLPSYYGEGVPRTLLEALAMGKPIITTNHTGCRETVDDGENGYLVPIRDAKALAGAIERMIRIGYHQRLIMSEKSRAKAVKQFDDTLVNDVYLALIAEFVD